jgi:hypothetical protein
MSNLNILPSTLNTENKGDIIIDHGDGVKQNIEKDEVYINVDFEEVRKKREIKEKEIKENSLIYGNISDDRLLGVENELFGEDLKEKEKELRKIGPMGFNGARVGFSRRNRETLQESNTEINPFIKYQQIGFIQKNSIRDFDNVKKDFEEGLENEPFVKNIKPKNTTEEQRKRIKFEDILEMNARDTFGLMGGNMRENVDDLVNNYKKEYIENNVNSISSLDNPSGRYRGGFERQQFLTEAQNNKEFVNNDIVRDKAKRINIDSYFTSFGNTKNNTEVDKDNEYEREAINNKTNRNRLNLLL